MDHSWLRFSTKVSARSPRSIDDCVNSLRGLIAPPRCFKRPERLRPFRGRIEGAHGWLRLPFFRVTSRQPSRALIFDLIPIDSGTELQGEWRLLNQFRIPVAAYLGICILAEVFELVRLVILGHHDSIAVLIGPMMGFAMIYGWAYAMVCFNNRTEIQLMMAIRHAMESESSAKIVKDLLSIPQ